MSRVWQLVPFLESGDAIGDHARHIAAALGSVHAGFVVQRAAPEVRAGAVSYREARPGPGDVLVYHLAHASPLAAWAVSTGCRLVVDYHGITPPASVRAYDPGLAVALAGAEDDRAGLAARAEVAVAHSSFMEGELRAAGFERTVVLPLMLDGARLTAVADDELAASLGSTKRGHDLLIVGRLAPNKRVEDAIKAFAVYRRAYDLGTRLFIVGRADVAAYAAALHRFVERLGVEEVHFAGRVSLGDLAARYRAADALVSMSDHEGFGLPLLEAMTFGLPVLACRAAAVPETVGDAGILFSDRCPEEVAALVDAVLGDPDLVAALGAAGRARAAAFGPEPFAAAVRELFTGLL